jgi:hypothetical protein
MVKAAVASAKRKAFIKRIILLTTIESAADVSELFPVGICTAFEI